MRIGHEILYDLELLRGWALWQIYVVCLMIPISIIIAGGMPTL